MGIDGSGWGSPTIAESLSLGLPAARMGLDSILERARPPRPNEQLVALLLDVYADDRADWDEIGWGVNYG